MDELRVLILPLTRRDGEVTRVLLAPLGISCVVCADIGAAVAAIGEGAGALVLTDVSLTAGGADALQRALTAQPPWSDLPVVLLCADNQHGAVPARAISYFTNVTLLDRPASARVLLSAIQAALRGRKRQYDTREQLAALERAEATLRARETELRGADRRKDEFLAMLAHELRNPLAPIRNVTELLARVGSNDTRVHGMAEILRRQIVHLTRLVDDLLDVSRITQRRIELRCCALDLAAVIAEAQEGVHPLIAERGHSLNRSLPAGVVLVHGDQARLVQCVSNLLLNAAKYTDPGGVIEIELRVESNEAVISVRDNGVGIAPDLLPHVFDLFVQGTQSLDRSQGGLGIGLSVVRQLVEMHNGRVSAHSDGVGRGAQFELRLPLLAEPQVQGPQTHRRTAAASRRILIVDDNRDAADSLAMILNAHGHRASAVYGPEAALRSVSELVPEVVLLDIGLPGMDGYQVAARIRAQRSSIRIVALTGYGRAEDVQRAAAAGFDAHLVKPVDFERLAAVLAGVDAWAGAGHTVTRSVGPLQEQNGKTAAREARTAGDIRG